MQEEVVGRNVWRTRFGEAEDLPAENSHSLCNLFALKLQKICVCVRKVIRNDERALPVTCRDNLNAVQSYDAGEKPFW